MTSSSNLFVGPSRRSGTSQTISSPVRGQGLDSQVIAILIVFPLTGEQRKNGAIILHIFAAFYFFTLLAVVCNDYFLPTIECICEDLKITPDVAAATFMAVSGAIPEFFTNMISTFITESEMGLGAVIGTLFFNTLGVAACAGIATRKPVQLEWYPLARDCLIFAINVSMLTAMSWDGVIQWYEGMILSIGYVVYWLVLFQNERIKALVSRLKLDKMWCCRQYTYGEWDGKKKLKRIEILKSPL